MRTRTSLAAVAALSGLAVVAVVPEASATTIIRDPNPPKYKVEIEPKLNLAYLNFFGSYGGNAWGPGVRVSIPLMAPGFVKTINDSIAISFGLDILKYEGYYTYWRGWCNGNPNCYYDPSFWAVHIPVALQWNFWITDFISVFGEPGLTVRHAWYNTYSGYCAPGTVCYADRSTNDLFFTFFAGARFHFSDTLALTLRVGHPIDFSVGLSIFL